MGTKKHNVEWWHTDDMGRRIGWLWPEDFEAILESWYGSNWVLAFCHEFDMSRSQVDRYRHGKAPIPKSLALLINALSVLKLNGIDMPIRATNKAREWLPDLDPDPEPAADAA